MTAKTRHQLGHVALADEALRAIDAPARRPRDARSSALRRRRSPPPPRSARTPPAPGRRPGPGTSARCCSAVPASSSGSEPSAWTARMSPLVAQARLICSMARQTESRSPPSPPCSTGNGRARMSWLASSSTTSQGNSRVWRRWPRRAARSARRPARGRRRAGRAARRSGGGSSGGPADHARHRSRSVSVRRTDERRPRRRRPYAWSGRRTATPAMGSEGTMDPGAGHPPPDGRRVRRRPRHGHPAGRARAPSPTRQSSRGSPPRARA